MGVKVRMRLQVESLQARARRQAVAHFLHPGKTAGTAMKQALRATSPPSRFRLRLHTHGVRMSDLPRGDKFFFVVRDPVDRFVSGFNSRQRQGRPRYERPWSDDEARAFGRFSTPQALADALAGGAGARAQAIDALGSIEHVRTSYWYWFADPGTFRKRWNDVLFVGFQETLEEDVAVLAERLGVESLTLPSDDVAAHRSGDAHEPLSDAARAVLADWYRADYEFVELCRELSAG
jgi:hypothetical protein